jgi:hypothetical protein
MLQTNFHSNRPKGPNMVKLHIFVTPVSFHFLSRPLYLRNALVDSNAFTSNDIVCDEEVPFWGLVE